jgi:hypothetical protein
MLDPPWVIRPVVSQRIFPPMIRVDSRANRIVSVCGPCGLVYLRRNTRRNFHNWFLLATRTRSLCANLEKLLLAHCVMATRS